LAADKLAVVLDLMSDLLQPKAQAFAYDKGYFYPGPAVKDVPLTLAPQESQDALSEFGRPEYEAMIASRPIELPLPADAMVAAFRLWDERIGGAKRKG
jgi:putative spermidine/putrescine transport system substrate-binding protein